MTIETLRFQSPTKGWLSFKELLSAIRGYMDEDPRREYKIIVGTDSSARRDTALTTALIVHRVGRGAIYFLLKSRVKHFSVLRDRIFDEAMTSIMLAQELRSGLREVIPETFSWDGNEIHVDIGEGGPTKDLIEAITGMIRGYQFIPVIKPYAFGAFSVADRHTG
ncbi:MAG: ribonuclease H-like YkuK family protein [Parcubacteria group bacterium]|nr:ribonuclease H-like YkuK family protein [Parcubacteria group bacterium]